MLSKSIDKVIFEIKRAGITCPALQKDLLEKALFAKAWNLSTNQFDSLIEKILQELTNF